MSKRKTAVVPARLCKRLPLRRGGRAITLIDVIRGRNPIRGADILRSGLGPVVVLPLVGVGAHLATSGQLSWTPLLLAPIGASAVLALGVPASPLAQPRNVIVGNLVGAMVGVSCALLLHPWPALAAGAAVALSIMLMALLGCLHPPGGAVALGAALAVPAASGADAYLKLTVPVAICSVLLVLGAMLHARAVGRSYPHRAPPPSPNAHATRDPAPLSRVGFDSADIDKALAAYGELLDVDRADLDALFREVELQAHRRIHAHILCGEIMSRDVLSVDADQGAEAALAFLREHDLRTAPVIDADRRVVGLARRAELLAGGDASVRAVLDPNAHTVRETAAIETLLPALSSGEVHEAMVVDADGVLIGIITQTDLLGMLYRAHIVEAVTLPRAAMPGLSA